MAVRTIYAGIGCVLRKAGLLTKEGNRCVSNLLLYVILPCVIVNSFLRPNDAETTKALVIALACDTVFDFIDTGFDQFMMPFVLLTQAHRLGLVNEKLLHREAKKKAKK